MKTTIVILCLLATFIYPGWTHESEQRYGDDQMVHLQKEIYRLQDKDERINDKITEVREEVAEMRGRQSVTTGVAAGVPVTLSGLLVWWVKRKKKEE